MAVKQVASAQVQVGFIVRPVDYRLRVSASVLTADADGNVSSAVPLTAQIVRIDSDGESVMTPAEWRALGQEVKYHFLLKNGASTPWTTLTTDTTINVAGYSGYESIEIRRMKPLANNSFGETLERFIVAVVHSGKDGTPGADGKSLESIVRYYCVMPSGQTPEKPATNVTPPAPWVAKTAPVMTAEKPCLWEFQRITMVDGNGNTEVVDSDIGIIGTYGSTGQPGAQISEVRDYYRATASASVPSPSTSPLDGWSTSFQTAFAEFSASKPYLWNFQIIYYTSGAPSIIAPRIQLVYAKDGVSAVSFSATPAALTLKPDVAGTVISLSASLMLGTTRLSHGDAWTLSALLVRKSGGAISLVDGVTSSLGDYSFITTIETAEAGAQLTVTGAVGFPDDMDYIMLTCTYGSLKLYSMVTMTAVSDGVQGNAGPAMPPPRFWEDYPDDYQFKSGAPGDERIDTVLYTVGADIHVFRCIDGHVKSSQKKPPSSTSQQNTWWQPFYTYRNVATELLLAKLAYIENLIAGGIDMVDDNGNVVFRAREGSVRCNTGIFNNITSEGGSFTKVSVSGSINASTLDLAVVESSNGVASPTTGSIAIGVSSINLGSVQPGCVRTFRVLNPALSRATPDDLNLTPVSINGSVAVIINGTTYTNALSLPKLTGCGANSGKLLELMGYYDSTLTRTTWVVTELSVK